MIAELRPYGDNQFRRREESAQHLNFSRAVQQHRSHRPFRWHRRSLRNRTRRNPRRHRQRHRRSRTGQKLELLYSRTRIHRALPEVHGPAQAAQAERKAQHAIGISRTPASSARMRCPALPPAPRGMGSFSNAKSTATPTSSTASFSRTNRTFFAKAGQPVQKTRSAPGAPASRLTGN